MWIRRRRHRWQSRLEAALRAHRTEAPELLVRDLSDRVLQSRGPQRRMPSRIAFASGVSVLIFGTFASLGGVSYASSGAAGSYHAVKQLVVVHKLKVAVSTSSSAGQYPSQPKVKPAAYTPPKGTPPPSGGVKAVTQVKGTSLPFSGFSLLGTILVSLLLIGAGIVLRGREQRT
jgi:hypothetical protein